jgi:hypothetical protein
MQPIHVPRHPPACSGPAQSLLPPRSPPAWRTDKARALFGGVAAHAFHRCTGRPRRPSGRRSSPPATATCRRPRAAPGDRRRSPAAPTARRQDPHRRPCPHRRRHPARRHRPARPGARADRQILGDQLPPGRPLPPYRHGGAFARPRHRGQPADQPGMRSRRHRPPRRHLREIAGTERFASRACRGSSSRRPAIPRRPHPVRQNINPIWTYAHVPHGYRPPPRPSHQIERFAPGTCDRIVAQVTQPTTQLPPTTRTTSAATSSPATPTAGPDATAPHSTPTTPASLGPTSAQQPARLAQAPRHAATTPPTALRHLRITPTPHAGRGGPLKA